MPGALTGIGSLDLHAALYGLLAPRWWGPVGWLVGLWGVLLRAASFVARLGRRPVAILSSRAADAPPSAEALAALLPTDEVNHILVTAWPPLGDALVAAGFEPVVRGAAAWQQRLSAAPGAMAEQSTAHYREQLARVAGRLSSWPLQLLLNLPTLSMMGWIACETVLAFVQRAYLPPTYFQNGTMAAGAVWALSFVLLQGMVSLSVHRLRQGGLLRALGHGLAKGIVALWTGQLQALRDLEKRL